MNYSAESCTGMAFPFLKPACGSHEAAVACGSSHETAAIEPGRYPSLVESSTSHPTDQRPEFDTAIPPPRRVMLVYRSQLRFSLFFYPFFHFLPVARRQGRTDDAALPPPLLFQRFVFFSPEIQPSLSPCRRVLVYASRLCDCGWWCFDVVWVSSNVHVSNSHSGVGRRK